jgi:hypothetical protein
MLSRAAGASRSAIANDHGSTLPPDLEPDVGCNYHIAPVARRIPRPTGARVGSALAAPAAFSHSTASRLPPSREPPRAVPGRRKAVSGCAMLTREDHHALQVWCAQSNIAAHRMQLSAPQLEHMRERHRRLRRGRLRRARGASRSLSRASGITSVYRWFTFLRSLIPSSASRNLRLLAADTPRCAVLLMIGGVLNIIYGCGVGGHRKLVMAWSTWQGCPGVFGGGGRLGWL